MDNKFENIREHTLSLVDRKVLGISGIKDVDSFNEEAIIVVLDKGELVIRGNMLHISKLSIETGELTVDGEITSLAYNDTAPSGGILKKLFR